MLKRLFHKMFSVMMAMLLLLSTVSFTVEKHYCGNTLIDVAVFSQVEKCVSETSDENSVTVIKKSCCKDVLDVVEGQDNLTVKTIDDLDFDQQLILIAFENNYSILFEGMPKQEVPHEHYSPPNLVFDLQVIDQVFLI